MEAGGGRAGPGPRVLSWASVQPGNGRSRTPGAPRRAPLGPEPPALTCTGVREPLAPRPVPARSAGCSPALRTRGGSGGGDAGSARREATGAKRRGKRSSSAGSPSLGLGAAARPARSPRRVPARAARGWRPALSARRPAGRAGPVRKLCSLVIPSSPEQRKLPCHLPWPLEVLSSEPTCCGYSRLKSKASTGSGSVPEALPEAAPLSSFSFPF